MSPPLAETSRCVHADAMTATVDLKCFVCGVGVRCWVEGEMLLPQPLCVRAEDIVSTLHEACDGEVRYAKSIGCKCPGGASTPS